MLHSCSQLNFGFITWLLLTSPGSYSQQGTGPNTPAAPVDAPACVAWTLNNVTFDDGGTASGWFLTDIWNSWIRVIDWEIKVSGGDEATFPPLIYSPLNTIGNFSRILPGPYYSFHIPSTPPCSGLNCRRILLEPAAYPTAAGGSVPLLVGLSSYSFECYNCAPYRLIATGSLEGKPCPALINITACGDGLLGEFGGPACPQGMGANFEPKFLPTPMAPTIFAYGSADGANQDVGVSPVTTSVSFDMVGNSNCASCRVGFVQNLNAYQAIASYDGGSASITRTIGCPLPILDGDQNCALTENYPWFQCTAFNVVDGIACGAMGSCASGSQPPIDISDRPGDGFVLVHSENGNPPKELSEVTSFRQYTTWLIMKCGNNAVPCYFWTWNVRHDYDISNTGGVWSFDPNFTACVETVASGPGAGPVSPVLIGPYANDCLVEVTSGF